MSFNFLKMNVESFAVVKLVVKMLKVVVFLLKMSFPLSSICISMCSFVISNLCIHYEKNLLKVITACSKHYIVFVAGRCPSTANHDVSVRTAQ